MCYHCHTLKHNTSAPPHRSERCRDATNAFSKSKKRSAASASASAVDMREGLAAGVVAAGVGREAGAEAEEEPEVDVKEMLAELDMSEVWSVLQGEDILDFATLADMTRDDFRQMGISLGKTSKIMRAVETRTEAVDC